MTALLSFVLCLASPIICSRLDGASSLVNRAGLDDASEDPELKEAIRLSMECYKKVRCLHCCVCEISGIDAVREAGPMHEFPGTRNILRCASHPDPFSYCITAGNCQASRGAVCE